MISGNNFVKYIPPEIVHLTRLTSLNIANNCIKFLPAEMLEMSLEQFQLFPNPFMGLPKPPSDGSSFVRSSTRNRTNLWNTIKQRPLTDIERDLPRVLPLVELCLRALFSPVCPGSSETMLQAYYPFPLDEYLSDPDEIPPHIRRILKSCAPESVARDEDSHHFNTKKLSEITGVGVCSSPKHRHSGTKPVFIDHAEHRFSWERKIASVDVGDFVPVLWRGCQWGCLDYLDGNVEDSRGDCSAQITSDESGMSWGEQDRTDEDGVTEGVVQVLSLTRGGLPEDFDE